MLDIPYVCTPRAFVSQHLRFRDTSIYTHSESIAYLRGAPYISTFYFAILRRKHRLFTRLIRDYCLYDIAEYFAREDRMTSFKEQWDLEMALEVLKNKNVESKIWSDAAKWILLYGPPELQEIMRQASNIATTSCFPELEPERYTESGAPCYNVDKIAEALGITREEAMEKMAEMENEQGIQHLFDASDTENIQ